jgi:hypothetical protein
MRAVRVIGRLVAGRGIHGAAPLCLLPVLLLGLSATAQEPALQHRKGNNQAGPGATEPNAAAPNAAAPNAGAPNAAAQDVTRTVTEVKSPLNLPTDAGGEYVFGRSGEFIEIIFQDGVLRGYMSRESGAESDRGAPLTYFFSHTTVDGARISFRTYLIHGAWYSFEGTILRGAARSLADDGYYRLAGSLVLHDEGTKTEQRHNVNLKMSRQM